MELSESCELLKQGAEARIYKSQFMGKPCIVKERFMKKYRHPNLDNQLVKERIKAEAKAIVRCRSHGISTPTLYNVDIETRCIHMEYYQNSITAKEFILNASDSDIKILSQKIGQSLAIMHCNRIIHGDLTTSNILVVNNSDSATFYDNFKNLSIVFIDFGLAQIDANAEDKGVDLYVLERALISTHSIAIGIFTDILNSYTVNYKDSQDVIKKFEEVRARGRKRTMVG